MKRMSAKSTKNGESNSASLLLYHSWSRMDTCEVWDEKRQGILLRIEVASQ